jgi:HAD superfamily hydrolase (TIGR01549 family)
LSSTQSRKLRKLKAIIFDFDGVICESNNVKKEAFGRLFDDYSEQVQKDVVDLHVQNGGLSRYWKFEQIYKNILKEPLTEERSQELGEKFSSYVFEGVVNSPYVKGAYEFLQKYHNKLLLLVASGTPHEEMMRVIEAKGLGAFFADVCGAPTLKGQIINRFIEQYDLAKEEVVFVGDAINDYDGAKDADVEFIGRLDVNYANPFDGVQAFAFVDDIFEMEKFLLSKELISKEEI